MSQQENLRELFALIEANPNLPIIPLVDSEIVADTVAGRNGFSFEMMRIGTRSRRPLTM